MFVGGLLSETTHSQGSFNAGASSFNIVLAYANTGTWGNDSSNIVAVDNMNFSVIPEPSTLILLGMAGVVAGFSQLRRTRK